MAEVISDELLDTLEKKVEDLRNQFEQYFMGSRKRAPEQDLTTVQFMIRRLSNQTIQNTRQRFRFQQLTAKFNSYNQYWNRTMQQIDAGTYFRDRFKQKIRAEETPPPPKPAARATADPMDNHIDQVYQDFIAARKQCNQPANISRDKLAETIKKQSETLREKYKGKNVQFKVVVENGQAKLKATLK